MTVSLYNRIVQVLVYVAAVLVPLFYLPWSTNALEINKQLLLVVLASVGLVVWLLGVVVSGKLTLRTTPVDKGVAAVIVAVLLAAVLSVARSTSVFGAGQSSSASLVTVLAMAVLYFLAVNISHDRGRTLRTALTASVAAALAIGICQMLTWYFLPGGDTGSRAFNTVGTLNALGILAAVSMPLFAKFGARSGKPALALSAAGTFLSLVVLAILNWWVLWTVALVGMLAMIAFDSLNVTQLAEDYGGRGRRFALSRFIVPMVVIVLGAFLLLVDFSPTALRSQFPVEVSPSQRLSAGVVKGVASERLLVGYGPENFSLAFDRYAAGKLADTQMASWKFYDGSSEALNTLVHLGAVGLLAVALLLWCLVQVVARFGNAISESVARGEGAAFAAESSGTLAALLAMLAAALLYPFSTTLAFVFTVLLALAGLIVADARARTADIEERPLWSLAASLGFIVALILVLSAVYFVSVRYLADMRHAAALRSGTTQAAMEGMVRSIDLRPSDDRALRDASQIALALLSEEIAKQDEDPNRPQRIQNLMATAIQLAQRAVQVAPRESANWNNLGAVYQSMTGLVENVEQLAEDAFKKAADLRPGDPTFDNRIGSMWLARADLIRTLARTPSAQLQEQYVLSLSRAEEAFKRAIEKSPTFGLAIYNLGAVYDRQGKVDEAISQLERIAPYNANEPTLMFELGLLYIRDGRKDAAIAALRRATLLAPQFANARWYLALLLEDAGDWDGALAQLEEIKKTNAENAALQTKIDQVKTRTKPAPPVPVIDNEPIE